MTNEKEKDSCLMYGSFYRRMKEMPTLQDKKDMAWALFCYGFEGIRPDFNIEWAILFNQFAETIDRATGSWEESVKNGRKGGRPGRFIPQEEVMAKYAELKSWKEVAEFFHISDDTLSRWRNKWESAKPQNLSDSDTISANVSDSTNNIYGHAESGPQSNIQKEEDLSASQGEPEKHSETTEPPAGTTWDGAPYQIGDEWVRDFRRPGTAEMGTVRLTI